VISFAAQFYRVLTVGSIDSLRTGTCAVATRWRGMEKNEERHIDRVWDVMEKAGICMMVTRFAGGLRARPLEARPDRDAEAIWFLTDARGLKDNEIEADPNVCLTFVHPKEKVYLSITGKAFVSRDPERAKTLWNEEQQVWWPGGPEDPNLLLMRVDPVRAEMWDGPASSAVAAFEFAKARLTGTKPNLGENRKVTVEIN
jgi:general stress protein 26